MNKWARILALFPIILFITALAQPPAPQAQQYAVFLPIVANSADVLAFTLRDRFSNHQDIAVANDDGTDETILFHTADYERAINPAWSPDGASIAFVLNKNYTSSLQVMQADGSGVRVLTTVTVTDSQLMPAAATPTWSPDGRAIAFAAMRHGNLEIDVIGTDGFQLHQLVADGYAPAWSPDGTRIAFLSSRDGNAEIYTIMADGSITSRITNTPAYERALAWSPDGSQLAYANSPISGFFIQNMGGGAPQPVGSQGSVGTISWAPTGTRVAYSGYNQLYDVFVGIVNADGTQSIRLNVGGWPGDPAWRPRPGSP